MRKTGFGFVLTLRQFTFICLICMAGGIQSLFWGECVFPLSCGTMLWMTWVSQREEERVCAIAVQGLAEFPPVMAPWIAHKFLLAKRVLESETRNQCSCTASLQIRAVKDACVHAAGLMRPISPLRHLHLPSAFTAAVLAPLSGDLAYTHISC